MMVLGLAGSTANSEYIHRAISDPVNSEAGLQPDCLVENFETNDFSKFDWEHYGNASWTITSQQMYSGAYSARAGIIEDDESTTLRVTLECSSGSIRFYRKVSSESGCDHLKFHIDGVEKGDWSGEDDWDEASFSVTEGTRTFEWTYSKDFSASGGDDTAWIDDIEFPAGKQNILTNPGFELGNTTGWTHGGFSLAAVKDEVHSGNFSALSTNRTQTWHGPRQSLLNVMEDGKTYQVSGWVRLQNADSCSIGITIQQTDSRGTNWPHISWSTGYNNRWIRLNGTFALDVDGVLTGLDVYFEGPPAGVNFYVDDAEVAELAESGDWRAEADERIEQIRKRDARITVLSSTAQPIPDIDVQIRQTRHRFAFGSCINNRVLNNPDYGQFFKEHFEWAVMENESKWYHNEPKRGQVTYTKADGIYDFCSSNGIIMRGHCLYWSTEQHVQDWIKNLSYAPLPAVSQLRAAVESRMDSAVNHFKDKFVHWDINNEMIPGSFYKDRLGESIRVWMFKEANRIDPNCILFVNDYGVISGGGGRLEAYKDQITNLLNDGAPIHAIGVQCHMEPSFHRWGILNRFDQLAELGLPIWVTELDVSQPDENKRAADLDDFYHIAFSHPAVEGILMWGFWENSHWRSDCYIVNADWTLNEAGRRYEALMNEWTTKTNIVTDPNGQVSFRGYHGTYEVKILRPRTLPVVETIELSPGPDIAEFTISTAIEP